MNVVESLKHKLGPLPVWVWIIGVAAIVFVVRRFSGGSGTASSSAAGDSSPAGGGTSTDVGAIGAGGGSGGLDPTGQGIADSSLSGPGTPIVYDPLGGFNSQDPGGKGEVGGADHTGPNNTIPTDTTPGNSAGTAGRGGVPYEPGDQPVGRKTNPTDAGGRDPKNQPTRPRSSRGQTAKKTRVRQAAPELVSEHGQATSPHPAAKASAPSPAPVRPQTHTPPAVSSTRSAAAVHVDAGARSAGTPAAPSVTPAPAPNVRRPGLQL